jgi:hypothetical protein
MKHRYHAVVAYAVPLIVALSLSVVLAKQVRQIALSNEDNAKAFHSFSAGLEEYRELRPEWRTRFLSNLLAGGLVNLIEVGSAPADRDAAMGSITAKWTAGWIMLVFLIYIAFLREESLLFILGTFCAVSFAYTPGLGSIRIYPWDLPALFWFAVAVVLLKSNRLYLLAFLVPIATLFKETALLIPIAFLFWGKIPWRRRVALCVLSMLAGLAAKGILDLVTSSPSPLITMTLSDAHTEPRLATNLRLISILRAGHPLFINAGLLAALLLLPCSDRRILGWKVIALVFIVGNMLFGLINEYRIWLELVPPSLQAIDLHFSRRVPSKPSGLPSP